MTSTEAPTIDSTTDRYGRPLSPDPEATRAETRPVGVHIIPMTWNRYALHDAAAGAGISWHDRGKWTTEHVLHVELRNGSRWLIGYQDDTAIVNHGEGMPRTQGRNLYTFADSSAISAHPGQGTAGDIARWKAAGQWHEARPGDLLVLQCTNPAGELVETVAARLTTKGHGGGWLGLQLVEHATA